jgi:hypothetical protein
LPGVLLLYRHPRNSTLFKISIFGVISKNHVKKGSYLLELLLILSGIGWVLGYALVPGLAYWLKNFRYMQLCSVVILNLMMIWFYFLYESPRWQLTNGQIDRAEITIRKALKQNGKSDKNLKEQIIQLTAHLQSVIIFFY